MSPRTLEVLPTADGVALVRLCKGAGLPSRVPDVYGLGSRGSVEPPARAGLRGKPADRDVGVSDGSLSVMNERHGQRRDADLRTRLRSRDVSVGAWLTG
jgi:hypothetical protein